jgi:hypothetical protein
MAIATVLVALFAIPVLAQNTPEGTADPGARGGR